MSEKIGRNDLCSCGSGKKYKKCCLGKVLESREKILTKEDFVIPGMGVSCEKSKVGKCDFCENDLVDQEYTNVHKVHGRFCSIGCEFALVLEQDLFMIGSSSELIPHLRDVHCLTKDQIRFGIDRIFEMGADVLCGALIDWEAYY